MYSTKYFCPRCQRESNKLVALYGVREDGKKELHCEYHGYIQDCNCSPSDFRPVFVPDPEDKDTLDKDQVVHAGELDLDKYLAEHDPHAEFAPDENDFD